MSEQAAMVVAEGFLFVGDPHLRSRRPGRRRERDFGSVVLDKLEQAATIANERRLILVFLGDMFDNYKEEDETIKTRLLRILSGLWHPAYSNLGNHDMKGLRLSDSDTLSVIAESGMLQVARTSGPVAEFMIDGARVAIGMTPYGQEIPADISDMFPQADGTVWITHHDLAFDGVYPGATELFEIQGCGLVVNGHMHLFKEPIMVGQTMWCNFGNITRKSIDAINHEPSVWEFHPSRGLTRHSLVFGKDVFDLTGKLINELSPGDIRIDDAKDSLFVDLLRIELEAGPAATPDGMLLLEEIEAQFGQDKTSEGVQAEILALFKLAGEIEEAKAV